MIKLKYFEREDFNQLMNWITSPEFQVQWSGAAFDYPLTEAQLEKYIENANHDDADTFVYKVVHKETGVVIGHISLGRVDRKNKSARIGKVLVGDPKYRGQRIGQQMIEEVLVLAFDKLYLHRVSLGVFDFNQSAIACYEKAGFVKEGLLRDTNHVGNEYWSIWEMGILENEWRKKKNERK